MNFEYAYKWIVAQANIIVSVDKNIFYNNEAKTQIASYIRDTDLFKRIIENHKRCSIIFFCKDDYLVNAIDGTQEGIVSQIQFLINQEKLNIPSENWIAHTL